MKKLGMILALLVVCGLMTDTFARSKSHGAKEDPNAFKGKISVAPDASGTFSVIQDGKTDSVKITTNGETMVTIDNKSGKVADLKVGMSISITGTNGVAAKIIAKSK